MLVVHLNHPVGEPKCIGNVAPIVSANFFTKKYSSSTPGRRPYRKDPPPRPVSIFDGSILKGSYAS